MKRTLSAIALLLTMLSMMAQDDAVRVDFQGKQPTISDFLQAYLNTIGDINEVCDCCAEGLVIYDNLRVAALYQDAGIELEKNETLIIDKRNGYLLYEQRHDEFTSRIEMCFWNENDGKHKLFACVRESYMNGKYVCGQFDNREFYRYTNATRTMRQCSSEDIGIDAAFGLLENSFATLNLPRKGKDIIVKWWQSEEMVLEKTLKWNGRSFHL